MTLDELREKRPDIPWDSLPVWYHPKHGIWKPECREQPDSEFEKFYWTRLEQLVRRQWGRMCTGLPQPELVFCVMKKVGSDPLAPIQVEVPMVLAALPPGSAWSGVSALLERSGCASISFRTWAYVSPFFEWAKDGWWSGGRYEL